MSVPGVQAPVDQAQFSTSQSMKAPDKNQQAAALMAGPGPRVQAAQAQVDSVNSPRVAAGRMDNRVGVTRPTPAPTPAPTPKQIDDVNQTIQRYRPAVSGGEIDDLWQRSGGDFAKLEQLLQGVPITAPAPAPAPAPS